jgi:DNA-binding XRE family transcriptional regulator
MEKSRKDRIILSDTVKEIRKRNKETQQQMTDRLGVSQRTVAS